MNHASIASIAPSHPLRERATANSRTVLALAALVAAAASFGTPLAAQTKQGNAPASTPASGSGDAIIVKKEQIMFPDTKTVMRLESLFDGKKETYEMTSFTRDNNQKVIVRFSAPASMIGSDLLMLDRNVWLYDPKSAREMKIPSNQSFDSTIVTSAEYQWLPENTDSEHCVFLDISGIPLSRDLRAGISALAAPDASLIVFRGTVRWNVNQNLDAALSGRYQCYTKDAPAPVWWGASRAEISASVSAVF
ncbi:MAG TPA: hypothetical protein PKH40_01750 [Treponemataceae bacterium]|nr:hypothetical protein [Treponemataceae bacterium]